MRGSVALLTPEQPEKGDQSATQIEERLTDEQISEYDITEWGDVGHLIRRDDDDR